MVGWFSWPCYNVNYHIVAVLWYWNRCCIALTGELWIQLTELHLNRLIVCIYVKVPKVLACNICFSLTTSIKIDIQLLFLSYTWLSSKSHIINYWGGQILIYFFSFGAYGDTLGLGLHIGRCPLPSLISHTSCPSV